MLPVLQHLAAIHEDVLHADRVLMRLLERGAVRDRVRVEHDDVGEHAWPQEAARVELEVRRRQAADAAHRLGQRERLLLAHVLPEQAREVAIGPGVGG